MGYILENEIIYGTQKNYIDQEKNEDSDNHLKLDSTYFNFVNMGRLSPEKNQKNLISAFNKFLLENPKSRLYILGKGPLEDELNQHIIDLEIENFVFLLGHINTPYSFIQQADWFVLPSLYEGQPMVLLEAMTLGMKILASNIPANINVVGNDENYGLLTQGTTVDDIYLGLIRASKHKQPFEPFDYRNYNKLAIDSFYREIN